MQVRLLGPVAAQSGGSPLALGGRKQRAVFALLALHANRTVSLDRLVYEIWQDEPPAQVTSALQAYISRLRRMLAEAPPSTRGRIVTRPPGWVLELPSPQVDALRFSALVADARARIGAGRWAEAVEMLRSALGLWAGDLFEDLDDTMFAVADKSRLEEERREATELLFEAELATGADAAVAAAAHAFTLEHPYRERAWCSLMLALYRSGRQADALAAAQRLRDNLLEGLGLDPSPEAQRLEAQILDHDPALSVGPAVPAVPVAVAVDVDRGAAGGAANGPVTDDPIVGRGAELDAVVAAVNAAHRGDGRLVVIDGPAGMGKSTVLARLENSVAAVGGCVLRGGGVGAGVMPALWPWIAIMRRLREAMPEVVETLDPTSRDALAMLDPSLGRGATRPDVDPTLDRTRLYRAVVDLLALARARRPLAIVVDDAHWLDQETLNLLALAVDELLPRGVLFAVALRPDESPAARDAVAALGRAAPERVVRMSLHGLGPDDVARVVARVSGAPADPSVVVAAHARTEGNPFFVVELVQLLMSERRLDAEGVYAFLPAGVREVIRRRLDRLPGVTLALLTAIALLGRPVDVALLAAVTGSDDEEVLDGCEAAVVAGLLVDDATGAGFALSHDLVRQTLDETLSEARRVRLHARIGTALRSLAAASDSPSPELVVEIARHLSAAAPVVGAEAALPYLLTAADDSLIRLSFEQSGEFLEAASGLVAGLAPSALRDEHEAAIRARLGAWRLIAPGTTGTPPSMRALLVDSGPLIALDPDDSAPWWNAAVLKLATGDFETVAAATELLEPDDLPLAAAGAVFFVRGVTALSLGRLPLADASLEHAEVLARRIPGGAARGLFSLTGTCTALRGATAVVRGDDAAAEAFLREAFTTPDLSALQVVTVNFWTAWCHAQRGRVDDAAHFVDVALEHMAVLGDTFYVPLCRVIIGWSEAMRGDHSGLERAHDACEQHVALGMLHQLPVMLTLRAEAHLHHGEVERAAELAREAFAVAAQTGEAMLGPRLFHDPSIGSRPVDSDVRL